MAQFNGIIKEELYLIRHDVFPASSDHGILGTAGYFPMFENDVVPENKAVFLLKSVSVAHDGSGQFVIYNMYRDDVVDNPNGYDTFVAAYMIHGTNPYSGYLGPYGQGDFILQAKTIPNTRSYSDPGRNGREVYLISPPDGGYLIGAPNTQMQFDWETEDINYSSAEHFEILLTLKVVTFG